MRRPSRDAAWLAALAMLCQILVPALSARHHAALAYELSEAVGRHHQHHGGGAPHDDPAGCVVHMALYTASSPLASPPAVIPVRLAATLVERPTPHCGISRDDRRWRPQTVRAPPHSVTATI